MVVAALALLACLALAPAGTHALYEDQAGSFDWHQQLVGPVTTASLHPSKPRAFVGTSRSVVGSLNLRDGSIAWRRLLEDGDQLDTLLLLDRPALVVSVSGGGRVVRAWDQNEGGMRWEALLGSQPSPHGLSSGFLEEECQLAMATTSWLKVLRCKGGVTLSSHQLPSFSSSTIIHTHHAGSQVLAYGYAAGSQQLNIATLATSADGKAAELTVSSPVALSGVSAAGAAGFAALSADLSSLCVYGAGASELVCTPLSELVPGLPTGSSLKLVASASGFALYSASRAQPGAALLSLSGGSLSLIKHLPSVSTVSTTVETSAGQVLAVVEVSDTGSLQVQALSTSSGEQVWSDSVAAPRNASVPRVGEPALIELSAAHLGTYKKKDKGDGFRLIVSWEDGQVAMLQQGMSVWSRQEALGEVTASHFVDLPVAAKAAAAAGAGAAAGGTCAAGEGGAAGQCSAAPGSGPGTGRERWERFAKMQLLSLKVQFKMDTPAEAAELVRLREEASDRNAPVRDANGFRKLIVCLTAGGTVAALHNGNGHAAWSRFYAPSSGGAPSKLLSWRMYHDLAHAPQLLALKLGQGGYASVLDAHSGRELQRLPLDAATFTQVLRVHDHLVEGHAEQSVYLLVAPGEGAPSVQLLPDTPQSRAWFSRQHRSLYFWLHDAETNTVTGYGFGAEATQAVETGSTLIPTVQTWQLAPSQPILGVATRDPTHAIQTSVKVLGDRSIKYKYLNPNTLVLALGHTHSTLPHSKGSDDDAAAGPSVTLAVVDSATGRLLHSQVHSGAVGPVRLAVSENLAVAEMWDSLARRMTIVSMEMFDATPREFSVLDYLFNPNSTQPVSSFDQAPVEVLSQAFWTRAPSRFLAFTTTQQGITSKQLLVGMITDQLYGMDVRMLDPRRPKSQKLTPQEQEERLVPYQEFLPFVPPMMVSYDKQLLGLSRISVEPSRLESTCLIFASGVDLFYTRVAPARKYDSLEDDFSYGLLVVAMVGLGVGAAVMRRFTKSSLLAQKWN